MFSPPVVVVNSKNTTTDIELAGIHNIVCLFDWSTCYHLTTQLLATIMT